MTLVPRRTREWVCARAPRGIPLASGVYEAGTPSRQFWRMHFTVQHEGVPFLMSGPLVRAP
jgi:hypothetical protein